MTAAGLSLLHTHVHPSARVPTYKLRQQISLRLRRTCSEALLLPRDLLSAVVDGIRVRCNPSVRLVKAIKTHVALASKRRTSRKERSIQDPQACRRKR